MGVNAFMLPQSAAMAPQVAQAAPPVRVQNAFVQRATSDMPQSGVPSTRMPQRPQERQQAGPAMFSQPPAASPNPVGNAFKAFATGLVGPERIQAIDAQHEQQATQRATKALAWLQQAQAIPEAQRMDWTMQNAESILRDTGQDPRKGMQNAFARGRANPYTDANLQQGIAALSAQLGQAPAAPEYMNLGGGAVGMTQGGQFSMVREPAQEPRKPIEVNGRLVDPETYQVLGDFSDPEKPSGADWQQFTDASGQLWEYQRGVPGTERKVAVPQARVPGSDGAGGIKPPSGYQYIQNPETGEPMLQPIPGGPYDKGLNMNPQFIAMELQQSKDWKGVYNNFSDINDQAGRIRTMAARKDPAGDLALVVSFTKMLDPGSVAREGEVALTQSAASALQQAQTWLPRLEQGGTLLPDALRQDLLKAGEEMYGVYERKYHDIAGDYIARSNAYGFAPERVLMGYRPPTSGPDTFSGAGASSGAMGAAARAAGSRAPALSPDEQAELEALRRELGR